MQLVDWFLIIICMNKLEMEKQQDNEVGPGTKSLEMSVKC